MPQRPLDDDNHYEEFTGKAIEGDWLIAGGDRYVYRNGRWEKQEELDELSESRSVDDCG